MFKVGDIVTIKDYVYRNLSPFDKNIFAPSKEFEVFDVHMGGIAVSIRSLYHKHREHTVLAEKFQLSNGVLRLLSQEELERINKLNHV